MIITYYHLQIYEYFLWAPLLKYNYVTAVKYFVSLLIIVLLTIVDDSDLIATTVLLCRGSGGKVDRRGKVGNGLFILYLWIYRTTTHATSWFKIC